MTATATVKEGNGATVTWSTVTAAKFCTADDYNPGTNNPIPIPAAGLKYSYWKSHCLEFTSTFTEITNIKIYTDEGGFGAGIGVALGTPASGSGVGSASYDQATGTPGDTGDEVVANHAAVVGTTDFFGYGSASPFSVDAGPYSTIGDITNHIVLQMLVDAGASPGELSAETITWQYDEV